MKRVLILSLLMVVSSAGAAQTPAPPGDAASTAQAKLLTQGQQLTSEGKFDQAIALYRGGLQSAPNLWEAYQGTGIALDLKGDYAPARQDLQKAIELAPESNKGQVLRTMAVSYAFEGNTADAAKYEEQAFQIQIDAATSVEPPA